ncbi:MAG: hypothetical protein NVS1B11_12600 [Terriglobales bacterium]
MPKSQSESSHTPSLHCRPLQGRESVKENPSPLQMVRKLSPEEAKKILVVLAGDGDDEAKDLLQKFLEIYPTRELD